MASQNKNLIFPEDAESIISGILQKYGLGEDNDVFFLKFGKGEKTNGEILAELVARAAVENFSLIEIISELKSELGLVQRVAGQMAKEIKEQIIDLAVPAESEYIDSGAAAPAEKSSERKGKDTYREIIE